MREYQVRICERLRVKFPGPTRQTRTSSLGAARPLPPSADIGPRGQSVGQAVQFCFSATPPRAPGAPPRSPGFSTSATPSTDRSDRAHPSASTRCPPAGKHGRTRLGRHPSDVQRTGWNAAWPCQVVWRAACGRSAAGRAGRRRHVRRQDQLRPARPSQSDRRLWTLKPQRPGATRAFVPTDRGLE